MTEIRHCPECGKPMRENPGFPGYFRCTGGLEPTNDAPPYTFKCEGITLTDAAQEAFNATVLKHWMARQTEQN